MLIQVVVCTNTLMKESISVDEICHKHSIGFIKADICGVFASVFCDFGKGFQVLDVDGGVTDASFVCVLSSCLIVNDMHSISHGA